MNYYPFHIGDYLSATRHLSWEEDAAFRRLLDTYYTTEKPLPSDHRAVCRLVLATTDGQREAVRVVLDEFFEATPEGWVNRRADAEITSMREKQERQREKANKRWSKPRAEPGNAPAMPRHDETNAAASKSHADAMPPTPTPTPTPEDQEPTPSAPPTASTKLPDPPAWIDSEAWAGFVAMRKRERHPLTPRAAELIHRKLAQMQTQGIDPNDALDQSTRNGWRDVFAPRADTGATHAAHPPHRESLADRVARKCREADERDARTAAGWPEPAGDAHLLVAHGGDLRA